MDKTFKDVIDGLHNGTEYLSHSALREFQKSPLHFMQYKLRQKEQTPSMAFGSLVHCLVLEPDQFEERYCFIPDDAPKKPSITQLNAKKPSEDTINAIQWWASFQEQNKGKEIVSKSDQEKASLIRDAIYKNESSKFVFDQITKTEIGIKWENQGFKFRGFVDGSGDGIVCDLKIMADASPRKVERAILYDGYDQQAAHYTKGGGVKGDYYLVAADHIGHVSVFKIGQNTINAAWEQISFTMNYFKKCLILNDWDKSYDFFAPNSGIFEI